MSNFTRNHALDDIDRLSAEFSNDDAAWRADRQGYLYIRRCASFYTAMATLTTYTRCGLISYEDYKPKWQALYDLYFTVENCKASADMVVDAFIKVA